MTYNKQAHRLHMNLRNCNTVLVCSVHGFLVGRNVTSDKGSLLLGIVRIVDMLQPLDFGSEIIIVFMYRTKSFQFEQCCVDFVFRNVRKNSTSGSCDPDAIASLGFSPSAYYVSSHTPPECLCVCFSMYTYSPTFCLCFATIRYVFVWCYITNITQHQHITTTLWIFPGEFMSSGNV